MHDDLELKPEKVGVNSMIVVSNRIQVASGYEKDFENRFEGRARLVEKQPEIGRAHV